MSRPSAFGKVAAQLEELGGLFRRSRREALRTELGDGKEHPDPTPHELAVEFQSPPSIEDMIRRYVRNEVSSAAQGDGYESWEEADDFEPEDPDELPFSPYVLTEHQLTEELPLPDADPPPADPSRAVQARPGGPEGAAHEDPEGPENGGDIPDGDPQ